MKIITICTQKGGVSKTTTAEALILGLRRKGYKVLAMDLDQQGNLTDYLNPEAKHTAFDLVYGNIPVNEIIDKDLIGGGLGLRYLPEYFKENDLDSIGKVLNKANLDYDVMVIDTPPAINTVVLSALTISDYIIMPTEPTKDSLDGIGKTIQACEAVRARSNDKLEILGVLLVKFRERYILHNQFKDALKKSKKFPVFDSVIRESQAINVAKAKGLDFFGKKYMHAQAVQDYRNFVKEVIDKIKL